ncbi:MAG: hypothetical protein D6729_00895 [Deltaproteobacteria bacterium]|nr:MAG: hypothetical protein D6729_00895 [Deltaproteobacteria bacterium]
MHGLELERVEQRKPLRHHLLGGSLTAALGGAVALAAALGASAAVLMAIGAAGFGVGIFTMGYSVWERLVGPRLLVEIRDDSVRLRWRGWEKDPTPVDLGRSAIRRLVLDEARTNRGLLIFELWLELDPAVARAHGFPERLLIHRGGSWSHAVKTAETVSAQWQLAWEDLTGNAVPG